MKIHEVCRTMLRLLQPVDRYVSKLRCGYPLPPQPALSPRPRSVPGRALPLLSIIYQASIIDSGWYDLRSTLSMIYSARFYLLKRRVIFSFQVSSLEDSQGVDPLEITRSISCRTVQDIKNHIATWNSHQNRICLSFWLEV